MNGSHSLSLFPFGGYVLYFFHYVFVCLPPSLCEYAHVSADTSGGQKRVSDTPPEMELQVVVTCL